MARPGFLHKDHADREHAIETVLTDIPAWRQLYGEVCTHKESWCFHFLLSHSGSWLYSICAASTWCRDRSNICHAAVAVVIDVMSSMSSMSSEWWTG